MIEKTEEEKIRELAASQLVAFMRDFQMASLRLRCAEIVWAHGSQDHRAHLDVHAGQLYRFAVDTTGLAGEKKIDNAQ